MADCHPRLHVRLCLLKLSFPSFISSNIHRNLCQTSLQCQLICCVWPQVLCCQGFCLGTRKRNFVSHTGSLKPLIPLTFQERTSWFWVVSAVVRRETVQNAGKTFTHICLTQKEYFPKESKTSEIPLRKMEYEAQYQTQPASFWQPRVFKMCCRRGSIDLLCIGNENFSSLLVLQSKYWSSAEKRVFTFMKCFFKHCVAQKGCFFNINIFSSTCPLPMTLTGIFRLGNATSRGKPLKIYGFSVL